MLGTVAIVCLCCALPGLLLRRFGPWPARGAAVLALAALYLGVLDLPREELSSSPAEVVVLGTKTAPKNAAAADWRQRLGRASVSFESADGTLAERIGRARLRHREPADVLLVWNGRVAPGRVRGGVDAALLDATPAPLDPDAVRVRFGRGPRVGRPTTIEVAVTCSQTVAARLEGTVRVLDANSAVVAEHEWQKTANTRTDWTPQAAGRFRVHLKLRIAGVPYDGGGEFDVRTPDPVLVVGEGSVEVAKMLVVQGVAAQQRAALPEDIDPARHTLVLLDPVAAPADQQRLVAFVTNGGGLFLVGAAQGGAVPAPEAALAAVSPVRRRPLPKPGPGTDPKRTDPDRPDKERPDKPQPTDPPKAKDPRPKPPDSAKGDTTKAKLTDEKKEVKRRTIAMVLLIDRSGSMSQRVAGNTTRMDLAKASAKQTARALDDDDWLGIVTFGDKGFGRVELRMTKVANGGAILRGLAKLRATPSGTFIASGLDKSCKLLEGVRASVKHVVVVTDGVVEETDQLPAVRAARALRNAGATLCIVQVLAPGTHEAADAATRLRELSELANGRVIRQKTFDKVPKLISAEVQRLRSKVGRKQPGDGKNDPKQPNDPNAKKDEPKPPKPPKDDEPKPPPGPPPGPTPIAVHVVEDSALLRPEPAEDFPPVFGLVAADARPGTRTLLAAGADGVPLLAFAHRGLGRVGVFTADLTGPWSRAWRDDPAFPGRLAQWVAWLAPAAPAGAAVIDATEVPVEWPLPREVAAMARAAGQPVRPTSSYLPKAPTIRTEVTGRAAEHAWYGLWFLVLLAAVEFVFIRRRG